MIQALTIQKDFGKCEGTSVASDKAAALQLLRSGQTWLVQALTSCKAILPSIAIAGAVLLGLCSSAHRPSTPAIGHRLMPVMARVVVGRGESLWQIASHYGDSETAIQDRVDALARLNGLRPGAPLIAGQRLLVPVSNPIELARRQVSLASR